MTFQKREAMGTMGTTMAAGMVPHGLLEASEFFTVSAPVRGRASLEHVVRLGGRRRRPR